VRELERRGRKGGKKCQINKRQVQKKQIIKNDIFYISAEIKYFTPSAKSMIVFNEPIILPDDLNANSSVYDFFNVWIEDTHTFKKVDEVLDVCKFENIYSQYWYFNYTFFNETYFKHRNCSIVMQFKHPNYSSFHDQKPYPLENTTLRCVIPPQGEFYIEEAKVYVPPDYGEYWVSDFFMPFTLLLIVVVSSFIEVPLSLIWWSYYSF